jgi:NNP family nitrate/nitrite transporter-like MFS transporter
MTLQKDTTPQSSTSTWTMWMSMITMALAFVIWSMVSPIAPQIQKLYHLPLFDKSLLVAIPVLLGSLLRIPLGMLADRFGGRRVYTLLMLFILIPLAGMATANSLPLLLFWEILLGAAGASFAVGIAHVSVWYPPEKQGFALGITAFGNIGTAIAGFTIPSLYLHVGFSNTFFIMMIPAVIGAVLIAFFTKDPVRKAATNCFCPLVMAES